MKEPKTNHFDEVFDAISFIEKNIHSAPSVQDVCSRSQFSSWQFQRIFRALTGNSVGHYIRGRRLTLAAQYLREEKPSSMAPLLKKFSFRSLESFSRSFSDYFGISPSEVRSNPDIKILPPAKPEFIRERIEHISKISKTPSFEFIEHKTFVGKEIEIPSPLGGEYSVPKKILEHWEDFNRCRESIHHQIRGFSYGFVSDKKNSHDLSGEDLNYFAAVEVFDLKRVPEDMKAIEIKKQKYAIFEINGGLEMCQVTADFIYGVWLPHSDFTRAAGFDFEMYHRYGPGNEVNKISYYLPVNAR